MHPTPTPHRSGWARLARPAVAAALAAGLALPAAAAVLTANSLNVYRDGTSADWLLGQNRLLGDSFDNGDPLVGANFSSTGLPATYTLQGLANAADFSRALREQNGQLLLDSTYGAVAANAQGQLGNSLRLRLGTSVTDPTAGLNNGRSFAASLRLSLAAMPDVGQTFGFRLTDGGIGSSNNDVVELFVSGGSAVDSLVFRKQDFDNNRITVLGSVPMPAAPLGASTLVLSLAHSIVGSNQVFGSYGFADASGALIGSLTGFANSATIFQGEAHTRIELRASGVALAVPEPGTWALLAAGLGLGLLRHRRRPG